MGKLTPLNRLRFENEKPKVCTCNDWDVNADKLIDLFVALFVLKGIQYEGKQFEFCPWCGEALK